MLGFIVLDQLVLMRCKLSYGVRSGGHWLT